MEHNEEWKTNCYCRDFKKAGVCKHRPSQTQDNEEWANIKERVETNHTDWPWIKAAISSLLTKTREEAFDAGGKTVGGTGRVMYQRGHADGRQSLKVEIEEALGKEFHPFSEAGERIRAVLSLLTSNTDKV